MTERGAEHERTVIVTGASSGLGAGIARVFGRAGWNVVAAARRGGELDAVVRAIQEDDGRATAVPTDVSDSGEVARLVETTLDTYGRVDVLVNNAALDHPGPIAELRPEQWDEVIGVNLNGVFYATRAVFPTMVEQGGGYVVNISSVAGRKGWPNASAYCASKFALTGFTQALSGEGAEHGIRASVVYPGGMDTPWNPGEQPEFLQPDDVGRFLLHLVTQDPRMVVNEAVVTPIGEAGYP